MTIVNTKTDDDIINRLRTLYTKARQNKRYYYDNWYRNYRLINNRMGGRTNLSWAPAPRDSEIYPTVASLVAWMADQHTLVTCTAAADPGSPYYNDMQKLANDLATVIQTNWSALDYESQIKLVLWDAFQFNAGFFKVGWDQGLDGGQGNVTLRRVDPWAFYVDPNATSMDDSEYFVEVRRMSLNEIERRWPDKADELEDMGDAAGSGEIEERPTRQGTPSRTPMANPGNLAGGQSRWANPSQQLGPRPGVVVYEFWIKENDEDEEAEGPDYGERQVNYRWRVIVMASNIILMDEYADELWGHGSHPYERYVWDDTGEFYGIALVDHLAYPQIYINRLLTALQQNAELVGNPVFLEGANSGLDRVGIVNKPGQRLRLNGPGAMSQNKPEWLTPPSMPPSVQQLVDFWIARMDNVSGLSAAVKGSTGTTNRTSSDTMSTVQEAAFVRVRAGLSNLESSLRKCAMKMADLIIDNYDTPRYIATIGPSGSNSAIALRSRHFSRPSALGAPPFKYAILVQAGASMPTSRQARMKEADQAYLWGLIDRQAWFEAHEYPNWQAVLERVNQAMASGAFQPPGQRQRRQKGGSSA